MDAKELNWLGSSHKNLRGMPEKIRKTFGQALRMAQNGLRHPDTKTLSGFKPTLVEILEDDDGDTYRAIYTAQFEDVIYVLHCFKKKSTRGASMPKADRKAIESRLAEVRRIEADKEKARKKK